MMRNPKRIKAILNKIQQIWTKYPDLRLMQLLLNYLPNSEIDRIKDQYYTEDDVILKALEKYE